MSLSTHPGFLKPEGSLDELLGEAAVHELFHAIQRANPDYYNYASNAAALQPGPKKCEVGGDGKPVRGDQWLTEGTASAVQIQYMEREHGYIYEHAFNGSSRATWVRYFDQPLDWGSLPPENRAPSCPGHSIYHGNGNLVFLVCRWQYAWQQGSEGLAPHRVLAIYI